MSKERTQGAWGGPKRRPGPRPPSAAPAAMAEATSQEGLLDRALGTGAGLRVASCFRMFGKTTTAFRVSQSETPIKTYFY